jgi:hypothetical protein
MFFKKSFFFALALTLVLAGNAMAGPNAAAVVGLDVDSSDNKANDGNISGTVAGSGTDIVVEVFASGMAGATIGSNIKLTFDTAVLTVKQPASAGLVAASGLFGLGATAAGEVSIGGIPPGVTLTDGYFGKITFTTVADVTGQEFTIGVSEFVVVDGSGVSDTLAVTTVLRFNSVPKVSASSAINVVPRGGQAVATVTASGFAAGATVTFTTSTAGSATVAESTAGNVLTLTASGSGAATVTVTASDGTTTTAAVQVQFDEQVPVELASFAGEVAKETVVLNWATASQTNNAGFRVLRSTDQESYEVVSELISGAGTTDVLMPYSFTDVTVPASEQVFYVLEQIDLDGTIHRSNPIEVVLGARFLNLPSEFASAVYPNPFNPATTISYDLPVEGDVSIVIYDAIGQEIRQLVNNGHTAGRYSVQWDAKDALGRSVGSGVYIAKIKAGTFLATQKMLLLK